MSTGFALAAAINCALGIAAWFGFSSISATYCAACWLLLICQVVTIIIVRPERNELRTVVAFSGDEKVDETFRKYYIFFRAPFAARGLADLLDMLRMFGIVWLVAEVWSGLYVVAGLQLVYFIASQWAIEMLHPLSYHTDSAARGSATSAAIVKNIDAVLRARDRW